LSFFFGVVNDIIYYIKCFKCNVDISFYDNIILKQFGEDCPFLFCLITITLYKCFEKWYLIFTKLKEFKKTY